MTRIHSNPISTRPHTSGPRFSGECKKPNLKAALETAYAWTQWPDRERGKPTDKSEEIGFYQEGSKNPTFHVVSGENLKEAKARKQPHLVILQRHNRIGESIQAIYG